MNNKIVAVVLGVTGAGIILSASSYYGTGLSNDSVGYIATARNIAAGLGAVTEYGTAMTVWAPLYPVLLALIKIISGLDPLLFSHYLNAVVFGLVIYLAGVLFLKHLAQSSAYALLGTAVLVTSPALVEHSLWTLSETLFICFVLLYFIFVESYLAKASITSLLLLSLSVSLACLTRYIGIILIFTGLISILFFRRDNMAVKARHLTLFIGLSALPIGAWITRNYLLSGTFFGPRAPSIFTLPDNFYFLAKAVQYWYFPEKILAYPSLLVLLCGTTVGLFAGLIKNTTWRDIKILLTRIRSLALFIFVYVAFLLFSSTTVAYDQIGNRLLSPIYIPVVILTLLFIFHSHQLLLTLAKHTFLQKWIGYFLLSVFVIWMAYPLLAVTAILKHAISDGEGYNSKSWRHSPVIAYLKHNPSFTAGCTFYANVPEGLYIHANIVAERSPKKTSHNSPLIVNTLDTLRSSWPKENKTCLVWFKHINPPFLFTLAELQSVVKLQQIADFDEGTVYSVNRH